MKKRLHDQKAGFAILIALFVVSLLEVVFRVGCLRQSLLTTTNAGQPLATAIFSAMLMIFTLKGKHRICYICYGAWLAYFVLDQVFGLPGAIANLAITTTLPGIISVVIRIICMINIIAIGALLVEYMDDGTIYNRAFNILCAITLFFLAVDIFKCLYIIISGTAAGTPNGIELALFKKQIMLVVFNNVYHVIMTFLFAFFAYDSAKMQLKKTKLSK